MIEGDSPITRMRQAVFLVAVFEEMKKVTATTDGSIDWHESKGSDYSRR